VPVRKTASPVFRNSHLDAVPSNRTWLAQIGSARCAHNSRQQGPQAASRATAGRPNRLPAGFKRFKQPITSSHAELDRPADVLTMNRTYFLLPRAPIAPHDQAPIPTNRTYFADPPGQALIPTNRTYFTEIAHRSNGRPADLPLPALTKSPYRRTGHTNVLTIHHSKQLYTPAS
jgi:hypothetical protein